MRLVIKILLRKANIDNGLLVNLLFYMDCRLIFIGLVLLLLAVALYLLVVLPARATPIQVLYPECEGVQGPSGLIRQHDFLFVSVDRGVGCLPPPTEFLENSEL